MTDLPSAGDVTRLAAGVEALSRSSRQNTDAIARVREDADRRLGRHRFALTLTVVGLLIDLAISALFRLFFAAEVNKVSGQVDGLHMIVHGQTVPGLRHFIHASDNYLDHIHRLNHVVDSIGVALAGLAIVCLAVCVARSRRRKARKRAVATSEE
jgi:hypothetical protein